MSLLARSSARRSVNSLQCLPFVNRNVIRLIALDQVLRLVLGGVVDVASKLHIRKDSSDHRSPHSTCLGVPFDVITAFEGLGHRT
jgi:hypothetical protein